LPIDDVGGAQRAPAKLREAMRVLAIDTALEACAAAILDGERGTVLASETIPMTRGHAEALMPLIARVMDSAKLTFKKIDRIAVTVGPGSFTGLRVGISAARGIALASGKPAVGLSTLAAFAAPHLAANNGAAIIAAIDASHDNVYFQLFGKGHADAMPQIATIAEAVQVAPHDKVRVVGSAAEMLAAAWPADKAPLLVEARSAPDIAWVAHLGAAAQDTSVPPKPLYLRAPDARPQDGARLRRR
jgi:tRNA threonylcarbamoyl adenosine modification protein YeaZ